MKGFDPGQNGPSQIDPEEDAIHTLRALLLDEDRAESLALARRVDILTEQFEDDEALIQRVNPILGEAIRRKIRDSREEMIEALYPIIGQLVLRAVSESMRDLARTIDARMRRTLSPKSIARRVQAQVSGVSGADVMLRDALPFAISEIFIIHRQTGILLYHMSAQKTNQMADQTADQMAGGRHMDDSDVISGMLTAIQDFVRDAFSNTAQPNLDRDLDEIQYGDASILLETARHAYIAVVADGIEPAGFRTLMRQCIVEFNLANEDRLKAFDGNVAGLHATETSLTPLLHLIPGYKKPAKDTLPPVAQPNKQTDETTAFHPILYAILLLSAILLIWAMAATMR